MKWREGGKVKLREERWNKKKKKKGEDWEMMRRETQHIICLV